MAVTRAQQHKAAADRLRAKSRKKKNNTTTKTSNKTPTKNAHKTLSTASSSSKGLFDLPPEVRNMIYRYAIDTNKTIDVQYQKINRRRCRFNILPALTMASKQLKLETQRLFLESNELRLPPEILEQRSPASITALRRLYRNSGLQVQTLHIRHELNKRRGNHRSRFTAELTLSRVHGRVAITKQAYKSVEIGQPSGRPVPLDVCGCGLRNLVYNSTTGDILLFVQRLKERRAVPSCHTTDLSITDELVSWGDYCEWCRGSGVGRVAKF